MCLSGVAEPSLPELSGPAEQPDPGPAPAPAGEGGLVAGVPPQTSSQPRHEAGHSQPQLASILPPGRHGRVRPYRHNTNHNFCKDTQ